MPPRMDEVYFVWEHTNFARSDAVDYNLDSLRHKTEFLNERNTGVNIGPKIFTSCGRGAGTATAGLLQLRDCTSRRLSGTTPGKVLMDKEGVIFGKFASNFLLFVGLIIFGGLLQAWVLFITSYIDEPELYLSELFADGSLFFFSFSLACGAIFTILTRREVFDREWLNYLVGFFFLMIFFFAMLFYAPDAKEFLREDLAVKHILLVKPDAVIQMHAPNASHLRLYFWAQVICVALALLIAILIAAKDLLASSQSPVIDIRKGPDLQRLNGKADAGEAAISAQQYHK